jgi:N-acyl-D-aspartate/D-glutamate deacylase/CubicO group peptidase (beta-lactamase class C family)
VLAGRRHRQALPDLGGQQSREREQSECQKGRPAHRSERSSSSRAVQGLALPVDTLRRLMSSSNFRAFGRLLVAGTLVGVPAGGAGLAPEAAARIDSLFKPLDRNDRPGCAVGVVRAGELAYARGFGMADLERAVAISPSSVFDIGSVSKQFTAASIVLLAVEGKLSIEDDIRTHLPELPPYPSTVTIRHLLLHRGGLKDYIDPMVAAGAETADVTTGAEALAAIVAAQGVDFPAGTKYEYSNTGYFLLGEIVARVSGGTLPSFAAKEIFRPLGMSSTHFHDDHTQLVPNRALGYSNPLGASRVAIEMSDWEQVGDGSVFTTVEDLARWVANLESGEVGGELFLDYMATPGEPTGGDEEGTYGFAQRHSRWRGREVVSHGGSWAGYRAQLLRIPKERTAVAILCNFAEADRLWEKASGVAAAALGLPAEERPSLLIENATLVDGTGARARKGDLRIEGDRIAAVGDLAARPGETTFDAKGLVLAPGFVDTHSHADDDLGDDPDALGAVSQGITTVVGGQDGGSAASLDEYFDRLEWTPAAVNVASYVGHGTLRDAVLGDDFRRAATPAEVEAMAALLDREMRAGALGLSTGLEYDPGIYSDRSEVIALAKVAARHGGRYISHVRSEDRYFWEAIEEILAIGKEARIPVQISHVKLAMRSLWGEAPRLLARLEKARREGIAASADIYPYLYWHSTLTVLFPERDFENLATAQTVLDEIAPPDGLLLGRYKPEPSYAGKTVAEIAKLRGEEPAKTLVELIRMAEAMKAKGESGVESVIGTSMTEPDLERLLAWKETNLCTDGELDGRHPRGFGSYPRVLGRYVRERKALRLEEAVRKMTSLAADHVGLRDRGRLVPGAWADLVLLNPATVGDRATTAEPHALSTGIERVWVNGDVVFEKGKATGAMPGKVLRRASGSVPAR